VQIAVFVLLVCGTDTFLQNYVGEIKGKLNFESPIKDCPDT